MIQRFGNWEQAWLNYISTEEGRVLWELCPNEPQQKFMQAVFGDTEVGLWFGTGDDLPDMGAATTQGAVSDEVLLLGHQRGVLFMLPDEQGVAQIGAAFVSLEG